MISSLFRILSLLLLSVTFVAPQVCGPAGPNEINPGLFHRGTSKDITFIVKGTVVVVIDGDTLTVLAQDGSPHPVKLFGADAPELKQAWGQESADQLTSMVSGKEVVIDVRQSRDKGRYFGIVLLDGEDIGLAQIRNGMAWAYEPADCGLQFEKRSEYFQTERRSRADRKGLWADPDPIPPWTYRGDGLFRSPLDPVSKPSNSDKNVVSDGSAVSPGSPVELRPETRTYILGPRGGCYYVNDRHTRVYVADKTLCRK